MRIKVLIALLVSFKVADVRKSVAENNVAEGNMGVLECPFQALPDTELNWTYPTVQDGMDQPNKQNLTGNMKIAPLTHGKYLIVLNASTFQQGDYSCSLGNDSIRTWRLTVCSALLQTRHPCLEGTYYPQTCYPGSSCKLICPADLNIPGLSNTNTLQWHKENELLQYSFHTYYFRDVDEKDRGLFTCTRSYLYDGQLYNRTHTFDVSVYIEKIPELPTIIEPQAGQVFEVDLDSKLVIHCKAVWVDDFDELHWMTNGSFVDDNSSLSVYLKVEKDDVLLNMTASLIFMKVSEEHLSNPYSCILDTTADLTADKKNVTISLTRKARSRILFLLQVLVPIIVVIGVVWCGGVVSTVLYVKLRVDITLFLRDTVSCYSNSPDGKIYDAYMMCYKNDTDIGFSEEDKRWLEKVLEEEFSYKLCLYDRDVLPGEAVAESVLNCIEQSRRVVLIPTYPDPGSDSGLLSAIHAALVERQTRLVLIQTKATAALQSDPQPQSSVPEGLRLLANVGPAVIWRGTSSQTLSSSFWKHLRYHLPAPLQLSYNMVSLA